MELAEADATEPTPAVAGPRANPRREAAPRCQEALHPGSCTPTTPPSFWSQPPLPPSRQVPLAALPTRSGFSVFKATPTFLALELPLALLVDKAGGQGAEQDGCSQEADGGHNASQYRSSQPLVGQVRLREDV